MELNNIIFSTLLLLLGYFFIKYFIIFLKKSKFNLLIDNQFDKPQAFHENSVYRVGGIAIFFLLILVFLYLFFSKNIFFYEYISFCALFFILGLVDDLKANIRPKFRLIIMIAILLFLLISNELYIEKTGLEFLNYLLKIDVFSIMFMCICFLFIINGSNLIDGFNGLLGIHTLIIISVLLVINLINGHNDLMYMMYYVGLAILIFLVFNFPNAKIFLGDSGAYLIGTFIAVSTINTSILNPHIAPFFFCILLFYLFIEVFFSFFRKIIFAKQSPLLPDNKHFHMILYKFFIKKKNTKASSNYKVSIYMNMIYLLLIIPGIIFMSNGIFCRYYFFSLLFIYLYFYKILYEKVK